MVLEIFRNSDVERLEVLLLEHQIEHGHDQPHHVQDLLQQLLEKAGDLDAGDPAHGQRVLVLVPGVEARLDEHLVLQDLLGFLGDVVCHFFGVVDLRVELVVDFEDQVDIKLLIVHLNQFREFGIRLPTLQHLEGFGDILLLPLLRGLAPVLSVGDVNRSSHFVTRHASPHALQEAVAFLHSILHLGLVHFLVVEVDVLVLHNVIWDHHPVQPCIRSRTESKAERED